MPTRFFVVVATFLLSFLLYVDRTCISTAKGPIMEDLGLSDAQFGWIMSAFAFGYALFQTPSGAMADKLGPRRLLAAVVTFWSIFTGLTAVAWSWLSMLVFRFFFGAGEAGAFPGMARVVYLWIPEKERGVVKGINFSASRLGAAVTMPVLPALIHSIGWKETFLILMLTGFLWATIWWLWFRDEPSEKNGVSPEELSLIQGKRPRISREGAGVSMAQLFSSGNLWRMMGQYFASNFTFFFCLTWLYPHVKETYNLDYTQAGFYTAIPLLGGALGNLLSGWMVDGLYRKGMVKLSRKVPAILGFALASLGLLVSIHQSDVVGATFWLTIAIFGADMTLSPSWNFCIDIGGRSAGTVSGTMNMAGNLGSALVSISFPYLSAWTGGTETFFYIGAGLNILAIFLWIASKPNQPIIPQT